MSTDFAGVYVAPTGRDEETAAFARVLAERWGGPVHTVGATDPAEAIAAALQPGLPLAFHSSGTTGRTTCATYDAATRARHTAAVLAAIGLSDELTWCAMPAPGYAYGLSIVETHTAAGLPAHFLHGPGGAARLADLAHSSDSATVSARSGRPLAIYVTPQLVPVVLTAGLGPQAVRRVIVAGGRLAAGAARVLATRFPGLELTNMYGQAELGPRIATWRGPAAEFVEGDVGHPIEGVTVTIADGHGAASGGDGAALGREGTPGRILVTSALAAGAIIRDPARGPEIPGVPVDTGDRGHLDDRGHLIHGGRGDHVLNVAGTRLDIEAVRAAVEALGPLAVRISQRPAKVAGDVVPVVEVVGVPGERLAARDVRRALHAVIGPLAALCDVRIVDELDVGESGK